jgi:signal transduction histidine kinase
MKIFNFTDFDHISLEQRLRNYKISIKTASIVLLLFFVKFTIRYDYYKYTPLFAALYFFVLVSFPVTKKLTKNIYKSIWCYYFSVVTSINFLIYISGGMKAPGTIWLALIPFIGSNLLGRRGFFWGVTFVLISFSIFFPLGILGIEIYPFKDIVMYQYEARTSIFMFILTSTMITYLHSKSEYAYQNRINHERKKNENLLKILFHDLANPMQTIRLLVKKGKANRNAEEVPKIFTQIDKTSIRIVDILDYVRKLKAIEDKQFKLDMKPLMLNDCFLKIQDIFEDKIKEKNINFKITNNDSESTHVLVDQTYFTHQVLGNIISNAIEHSEVGGDIHVHWEKKIDEVFITIKDSGAGIPEDILNNLFIDNESKFRNGTNYGAVASDYGMPLVKHLIEEFKGSISVETAKKVESLESNSHGTTVTIMLPVQSNI